MDDIRSSYKKKRKKNICFGLFIGVGVNEDPHRWKQRTRIALIWSDGKGQSKWSAMEEFGVIFRQYEFFLFWSELFCDELTEKIPVI